LEKINSYFVLTYNVKKEGKTWLASCVELGTSVYGKSAKDAKNKLQEAISCHIETLRDVGELDRFFKENGIVIHPNDASMISKPKDFTPIDGPETTQRVKVYAGC
jgi:predicted RNase H-like HicB family nuclease